MKALRFLIPLLLSLFLWNTASAQKENNIWIFGFKAGIDFTTGSPVSIDNKVINQWEGISVMCNPASGALLFYTDGRTVWNRNDDIMLNGEDLPGAYSSTQSVVIVPLPGNSSQYYLFTTSSVENNGYLNVGLNYTVVDMSLDNGRGAVIPALSRNLLKPAAEKLQVVRHSNGYDYWVIAHKWGSNDFHTYLLTQNGVILPAVVSSVGPVLSQVNSAAGCLTASQDGLRLGMATYSQNNLTLFRFNNGTGVVSAPVDLPAGDGEYGIGFSPDGTKLYVSGAIEATVRQYNLALPTTSEIAASMTLLQEGESRDEYGAFQIGPDGKLYMARHDRHWVAVINNPNAPGTACGYTNDGVSLGNARSGLGLPNHVINGFVPEDPDIAACNVWYFGFQAGIDFSTGIAAGVDSSAVSQWEGISQTCDASASKLLLYSDGRTVWNGQGQKLPSGVNLAGANSSAQGALLVPMPGDDSTFYLFTAKEVESGDYQTIGVNYSTVDMRLNNGRGDVSIRNHPLLKPASEKLQAVRHSNRRDWWIITHQWGTNQFHAFLLSSAGLSSTAVISSVGPVLSEPNSASGYLAASPNGRRLGMATYSQNDLVLFDFDNNTGMISNPLALQSGDGEYGIGFSPDNSKLYVSGAILGTVVQFDLTSNDPQTIRSSKVVMQTGGGKNEYGAFQIGPDKRLYMARHNQDFVAVIVNPNAAGTACLYINNGVYLKGRKSGLGLPNFPVDPTSSSNVDIEYDDAGSSTTGIELASPNPFKTSTLLQFRVASSGSGRLSVVNEIGEEVALLLEDHLENGVHQFVWNAGDLPAGLYFSRLTIDGETVFHPIILAR